MLCGTGSFSHIDEDDQWKKSKQSANNNNNPYSNRGLDKFSAVLAELDARRENIMAKAKDVSMVRFMYNDSHQWVPIIVKLRDHHQNINQQQQPHDHHDDPHKVPKENYSKTPEKKEKKKSFVLRRTSTWGTTCYYWSLVMVLIMICLFMFGRVFAICCTSVWWYLVPSNLQTCRNKSSFKKHKDRLCKEVIQY